MYFKVINMKLIVPGNKNHNKLPGTIKIISFLL